MQADIIITIVAFVLAVAVFAWGLYEQIKGNAATAASAFIATVESSGLVGSQKMAIVVQWLYDLVPAPFKAVLTKDALQNLAQGVFDYMRKYANAYAEAHTDKGKEAYAPVNDDLASDVAKTLTGLSTGALKALAINLDVDVTGKDDTEIIKEIVLFLMEKA